MRTSRRVVGLTTLAAASVALTGVTAPSYAQSATARTAARTLSSTGLRPGQIKHVWLIILENKSYDATFTGLNQNSYLWKTLPAQGALLKNYYGTGHYSMDNYMTAVSGQATQPDTQADCPVKNFDFGSNKNIVRRGKNAGQLASPAGANATNGLNGCTYPSDVPTLFNQLDAAHTTWKGYAQDLHNQPGREDAVCGGPGSVENNPTTNPRYMSASAAHPLPPGVSSLTGAQANDQFVSKHFPFSYFHSLTGTKQANGSTNPGLTRPVNGGNDCDAKHIANLDDSKYGIFHDLQKASTTPAFSWITPDNCNDAHDAVCKGNNMSGSFTSAGKPIYQAPIPNPQSTKPKNYTGGLYASDLFLKYYVQMIEKSPAFKDGGLIDIAFDEGFPAFTYTGNSFNNANAYGPTLSDKPDASTSIVTDSAAENLYGRNVHSEPTGPNTPLKTDRNGNQLFPGPGNNAFIDRPPACTSTKPRIPAGCVPGLVLGGGGTSPAARTDNVAASSTTSYVLDQSIVADDTGRGVTDTTDKTGPNGTSPIPKDTFVGAVSDTGPQFPTSPNGTVTDGSFQLMDASGNPVTPTGPVSSLTLSAEGQPGHLQPGQTADPLYDAKDATTGGGQTGSVLISPLIRPGTVSTTFYNHYSWLRTMEDIFQVSRGDDYSRLPGGATVSGGLDHRGHLGFAAQPGLAPFGRDVFTATGRNRR
ncbi:MAG: alkaline phosphatase family protein [Actinomycetota bacterium]|nr:alkaline phosphatase family protein [Actinomycetota bacterium]